ncbi:MAG: helix-turn-helix domain-containing protein [Huintestinicola sp.]
MEKNKTEIIAQIAALLSQLVESESDNKNEPAAVSAAAPVEMLTIKECTEAVAGLSEHTIRQLVAQEKIPYIRTGKGKRGKILISKAALFDYLESQH